MIPNIVTYITFEDVYNRTPPSISEICKYFSTLYTPYLIQALCKLNISIWKSPKNIKDHVDFAVLFFNKDDLKKIYRALKKSTSIPFFFHRHQVLLAIKLALLNQNSAKQKINLKDLGYYLMAISQHIAESNVFQIELTKTLELESAREAISRLLYFSHHGDPIHNYARTIDMWLNIPVSQRGQDLLKPFKLDIYTDFKNFTGVEMDDFISITFMNLFHLYELDIHTQSPYDFMVPPALLSKTRLSSNEISNLYKLCRQEISHFPTNYQTDIKDKLRDKDIFISNFLPLVECPILQINDELSIVSDPEYLENRISQGIYWILLNNYSKLGERRTGRGRALSSYYGMLHQEYIHKSLLNICDEVIEVTASDTEKLCDFIGIIKKEQDIYLLVIDTKKISLSLPMELNSDRDTTLKNLNDIFYKKGFRQVLNTIKKIKQNDLADLDVDISKVKAIFPLIITDRFIAEETLNRYLYEKEFFFPVMHEHDMFYMKKDEPLRILSLMFISSEEMDKLEAISEKESKFSIVEILIRRHNLLTKRYSILEKNQFLSDLGMVIAGVDDLVENLEPFWNFLFTEKSGVYKNSRLKIIFDNKMENVKKRLFLVKTNQRGCKRVNEESI